MRLIKFCAFLCFLISGNVYAQCPPNIGFEENSFNGWTTYEGRIGSDGTPNITSKPPNPTYQQIISGSNAGLDKYGHFSTLCPNGSGHSVRLGDDYPGSAERLSYTYTIPAGEATTLKLNYAVVLANPSGHTDIQQARFTLKLYDVTAGKPIACPGFDFIARTAAGFVQSDVKAGPNVDETVYYKDWSTAIINLDGYQGKQIRFDFTTSDCTQGEHIGYAYFDIDDVCGTLDAVTGNVFCQGQTYISLHGPSGFDSYQWYRGHSVNQSPIGTGQNLIIQNPVDQDEFTLAAGSTYGLCPDTLHIRLKQKPTPFLMQVADKLYGCPGTSVDLASAIKTPGLTYTYHRDSNTLDYLPSPHAITTPGTYYIKGVSNPEGCTDVKPVEVIFLAAPALAVTPPAAVQYPVTIDLSTTHNAVAGVNYTYYKDSNGTEEIDKVVSTSGTYFIKATAVSSTGVSCSGVVKAVKVVITPPPPYTLTAPNTFTPNNDGINDEFALAVGGYVTFKSLKVFNRYGKLVFTAKSPGEYWRGTIGNKQVPTGTYYWIFEGVDSYYNTPVNKGGYVTVVR